DFLNALRKEVLPLRHDNWRGHAHGVVLDGYRVVCWVGDDDIGTGDGRDHAVEHGLALAANGGFDVRIAFRILVLPADFLFRHHQALEVLATLPGVVGEREDEKHDRGAQRDV